MPISAWLGSKIPHAAGCGYFYRTQKLNKIAVSFCGDGSSSEGDFHAALNFGSTLSCQTLFVCRNNVYAISTFVDDQYSGDGISRRGLGYGIPSIKVDGNDLFAVYNATI